MEVDASNIEKDAYIEFGASKERSKSQFRIILGGWNGEKSRISIYDSAKEKDSDGQTRKHTSGQWKDIRFNSQALLSLKIII